jgi:hypothetical protein
MKLACLQTLVGSRLLEPKIKQHMKNSNDSRVSIDALRVGAAAGTTGPMIFLKNDETMTPGSLSNYNLI